MVELIKIGIVNARNTDGYSLVYEYDDGTQSGPDGWYASIEAAREAATPSGEYASEYEQAPVEDWTND